MEYVGAYADFLLCAAECNVEDVACFVLPTNVAHKETYLLNSGFGVKVWEIEAAVFGRAVNYISCYGGYYPTFLQGDRESWGLCMVALGFCEETGSEWIFKCFHDGVVV